MLQIFKILTFLSLMGLMYSCSQQPKDINDYISWFAKEETGFVKRKQLNNLTYTVQYRPVDLMIINELKTLNNPQKDDIDSLKKNYGHSKYFLLEISPDNKGQNSGNLIKNFSTDYESYKEIVEELAFNIQEQVELIIEGDTLAPRIYHYEQGYELSSNQRFLFAFQTKEKIKANEMTFIYNDHLFGSGRLKFQFNLKNSNIPSLPI